MVAEVEILANICPECGGSTVSVVERGETVCKYCGLVVGEREIDISHSGIRAYSKHEKDKKEGNGSPISILTPDICLSTIIDRSKITNPDLRRAAKWNTHLTWENKNMLIAITELKRIGTNLNFPSYLKKSIIRLYKEVFKKQLLRGRSISGMVTACAYHKCKEEKFPITFQEILSESSLNPNIVKKCYKILVGRMKLKSANTDPISLIPKYCAELGFDMEMEKAAIKLLKNFIEKTSVCGKDPRGLCAGAIYLISKFKNKKISQKDISRVIKVTEVTLRSRYKEILGNLSFQF